MNIVGWITERGWSRRQVGGGLLALGKHRLSVYRLEGVIRGESTRAGSQARSKICSEAGADRNY